jgi:hypothetical protein
MIELRHFSQMVDDAEGRPETGLMRPRLKLGRMRDPRTKAGRLRRFGLPVLHLVIAGAVAAGVALLVGHRPIGAPLFAITMLEMVNARRRRSWATFGFGVTIGLGVAAVALGYLSLGHVVVDWVIGFLTAIGVAIATTPRNAVGRVNEALTPVLTTLTHNVRAVAAALRDGDTEAAKAAVYALGETDQELRRLDEVLVAARRSARVTLWTTGQDLDVHARTVQEVGYAVRNIRVMARNAWWGVLRRGQHVPPALPKGLEALADGLSLLRDELDRGGRTQTARPHLVSASRWIDVMREENLDMSTAAVAADADAAVLNLLIATRLPVVKADDLVRKPALTA